MRARRSKLSLSCWILGCCALLIAGAATGAPITLEASGTLLPSEDMGLDPSLEEAAWTARLTFDPDDIVLSRDATFLQFRQYQGDAAPIAAEFTIGGLDLSGAGTVTVGNDFFIAGMIPGQPGSSAAFRLDTWSILIEGGPSGPNPLPGLAFAVTLSLDAFVMIATETGPITELDFFVPELGDFDQARLIVQDASGGNLSTVAQGVASSAAYVPEPSTALLLLLGALAAGRRSDLLRG